MRTRDGLLALQARRTREAISEALTLRRKGKIAGAVGAANRAVKFADELRWTIDRELGRDDRRAVLVEVSAEEAASAVLGDQLDAIEEAMSAMREAAEVLERSGAMQADEHVREAHTRINAAMVQIVRRQSRPTGVGEES